MLEVMESVNLTFLGTGNSIPTKLRNHTALFLRYRDEGILIDCGEGTQRQFSVAGLSHCKITRLLITHWHGDHILGIPGLLQTLSQLGYSKTLHIYGPTGTKRFFTLIEQLNIGFKIPLEIHEVSSGVFFETSDFALLSDPVEHGIPSNAYTFLLKDRLRLDKTKLKKLKIPSSPLLKELAQGKDVVIEGKKVLSKKVSFLEKGKKLSFVLDSLPGPSVATFVKRADLLVCEATYLSEDAEKAQEHKHLTASDAAHLAKSAKVKHLILTHVSPRYERDPQVLIREAKKIFKTTTLASDFDSLTIN